LPDGHLRTRAVPARRRRRSLTSSSIRRPPCHSRFAPIGLANTHAERISSGQEIASDYQTSKKLAVHSFRFCRRVVANMWEIAGHVLRRELRTAADDRQPKSVRRQTADSVDNAERHVQGKSREIRR